MATPWEMDAIKKSVEAAVAEVKDTSTSKSESFFERDVIKTPANKQSLPSDIVEAALQTYKDSTSLSKEDVVAQVSSLVGKNVYAAGALGAFTKEAGVNFDSLEENTNYSLANAKDAKFSQDKITNALNTVSPEVRAKIEAGGRDRSFGEALMSGYGGGGKYHGRGLIHITHDYNYKAVGDRIGVDLVSNPELVNDPKYAVPAALAFLDINGYFDTTKPLTKNRLHNIVNRFAGQEVKDGRWNATQSFLKEFGKNSTTAPSTRPKPRPEVMK